MTLPREILSFCTCLMIVSGAHAQGKGIIAKDAKLQLLSDEFEFTEGPAADEWGNIYFTDQPNNKILKWTAEDNSVEVFMEDAGRANGLYFDAEGNLMACADENSEIWKINKDKNVQVLVKNFQGKRLNGPNDLWVDPRGGIYITDPYYQRPYWQRTEKEIVEERVYYLAPEATELKIVAADLEKPNGIIGTPDGKKLYVADIGAGKTWSYSIAEDGSLSNKTLFANLGSDGMTIDDRGNIYLTGDGVTVFNSKGEKIEDIAVDRDWTANVTFGGSRHNVLFITAMNSVFVLEMNVKGVRY